MANHVNTCRNLKWRERIEKKIKHLLENVFSNKLAIFTLKKDLASLLDVFLGLKAWLL
jgi:hypothetical protein